MAETTPPQMLYAPLFSAFLFSGGSATITELYMHVRDVATLKPVDWEPFPLERRLTRWQFALMKCLGKMVDTQLLQPTGPGRWTFTDKGRAVAKEFGILGENGALIERSALRQRLPELAKMFDGMYVVQRKVDVAATEAESPASSRDDKPSAAPGTGVPRTPARA